MDRLTPDTLREMARILFNMNRWDLEACGAIEKGPAGRRAWFRFNRDGITFLIHLPAPRLAALTAHINLQLEAKANDRSDHA